VKIWKGILRVICVLGVVACSFGFYFYTHNTDELSVNHYETTSAKYHGNDFTFVQLSDFHNHSLDYANGNLLDAVDQAKPDVVLITGDMVDNHTKDYSMLEGLASHLEKKGYPFYYVSGNHEEKAPEDITEKEYEIFASHGGHLLSRRQADLGNNIILSGIQDPAKIDGDALYFGNKWGDVPAQLSLLDERMNRNAFNVILSHRPDYFELTEAAGYDLTFSGHTHGGQLLLGNWALALYPWTQYVAGEYTKNASQLIVSRGLGYSYNLPVRYHCPCELVSVTLKSMK
jgi:predicted MPP superfamily phosphohydrolase